MQDRTELAGPEERLVTVFMQRLQRAPLDVPPRLPGVDVLLLKARLIRQWNDQRKVQIPIDVMEPLEIAATFVAAVLLLSWSVPSVFDWIPRLF